MCAKQFEGVIYGNPQCVYVERHTGRVAQSGQSPPLITE